MAPLVGAIGLSLDVWSEGAQRVSSLLTVTSQFYYSMNVMEYCLGMKYPLTRQLKPSTDRVVLHLDSTILSLGAR